MSEKQKLLADLKQRMLEDASLPLKKGATNLVFGDGNPDAAIMCIGEGPGFWEDKKGIPFVGNAGALLNQLLSSINIKREDVFITNVVHYRPPENRDPEPAELNAFEPYLDKMIDIINPQVVITLGRFSMAKFMPGVTISRVHGNPREISWKERSIWVIPMYHPAAGLRSTDVKRALFDDFKKIPEFLEKITHQEEKKEEKKDNGEQMKLV